MICSEFAELLDRYELLTDAERCELEKHASECEKCQSELEFFKSITSISTSIPLPKAPDTLIDEVNARLDAQRNIRFRPNVRILSTIAACLVLGISVGVNNGFIKKSIDGDSSDGVITETTLATEAPTDEATAVVEQTTETDLTNKKAEATQKAEKDDRDVSEKETAASDKKAEPTSATMPDNTQKPTAKPRTASVSTQAETKESDTPTNETEKPQATQKPAQTTAPIETADNTHNVDEYAVSNKREATVYGYYDTIPSKRSTSVMSDYLYVESEDMGTVVSTMSEMGIKNAEGYYMSSREDFYTLIDTLNDKGVGFDCDLKYNSGDNVSFRLTYN